MDTLLQVDQLTTHFKTPRGLVKAVDGVDLRLHKGEILGIVGESGSGKSVMAQSLLRVLPPSHLARSDGRVLFGGADLMQLGEEDMRQMRGARIAMVTQNPSTSLNPVLTVGEQLLETMRFHPDRSPNPPQLRERMLAMMNEVQLPNPAAIARRYPFQLSGGMKQRISIAMALLCEPELLIADEPTTALDVTIQAQILELIRALRKAHGTSVIFITHDLGVVAQLCDSVAVMYGGKVVEYNSAAELFRRPRHPYTQGLLASNPVFGHRHARLHAMQGQPPDLARLGAGCAFAPRCSQAQDSCNEGTPATISLGGHFRHMCPLAKSQETVSA
ncbi:MAG: ABC transporter ATP-binding protein [Betaproteobacteria bacterium]